MLSQGYSVLIVAELKAETFQSQDILHVCCLHCCSCTSQFLGIPGEYGVEGSLGQHEMNQAYFTLANSEGPAP